MIKNKPAKAARDNVFQSTAVHRQCPNNYQTPNWIILKQEQLMCYRGWWVMKRGRTTLECWIVEQSAITFQIMEYLCVYFIQLGNRHVSPPLISFPSFLLTFYHSLKHQWQPTVANKLAGTYFGLGRKLEDLDEIHAENVQPRQQRWEGSNLGCWISAFWWNTIHLRYIFMKGSSSWVRGPTGYSSHMCDEYKMNFTV